MAPGSLLAAGLRHYGNSSGYSGRCGVGKKVVGLGGRRAELQRRRRYSELDGERPATGAWYSRRGVGPAHGPRTGSVRVRRRPLAPRSARRDRRAALAPRERQGGDARGRVVVLETVWWG